MVFLLFSCRSLQRRDIHIHSIDESAMADLARIEENIVRLEFAPTERALIESRRDITSLAGIPDNDFQAILSAWSGRLALLEGRPEEAVRDLRRSQTLMRGNWPSLILESRMERSAERRLAFLDEALNQLLRSEFRQVELTDNPGQGELQIEKGRVLLELNRFSEAVASFDSAFNLLENKPFYRENYSASRNRAWDLRIIDGDTEGRTLQLVQQDGISWLDLIEITKTETDLLRFLTAGREWPSSEIFNRLLERSFIPLTQDINLTEWPQTSPSPDEIVLRSGTAWFLWHLHAENRAARGLLSRYSSRFANMPNARSPVNDLPLLSPFFDSILGCVETEIMSLPDGRNFFPEERIRGSAFLGMLRRLN
jgi:tetratricopeptide (TPR) repeat protein